MDYSTGRHIEKAMTAFYAGLAKNSLPTTVTVKVRDTDKNWVGMYRSGTGIRRCPIFWIRSEFSCLADQAEDAQWTQEELDREIEYQVLHTLVHEYGHYVAEIIRLNFRQVGSAYENHTFERNVMENEEEFAENVFWAAFTKGTIPDQPWYKYFNQ